MILTILAREPMHGYGISQRLAVLSHDHFHVNPGSLFPSLYRLEQDGKLKAEWRATENNRRAKYLPPHGRREAPARTASRAMAARLLRRHECAGGRMTLLHRLASVVRWIFNRNKAEADLNEELQTFVDMAAADHVRDGATPAEARRLAMLQLGGVEQAKERVRTGRHGAWLDAAGRDARHGLRQLRRDPAFSAIAIATLALGIGGMTAMFSVFDAVLIRPLPYADADRLVMIWNDMGETDVTSRHNPTPAEWIEWRRLNTVFTDLASSQPGDVDALGRRRTRAGAGAESHLDLLERAWRAADARACLHRGRRQQERARRRDQPRPVAAPLRRRRRHRRTDDFAQRRALRSDRRHAARLLLHAVARDRRLDAGVVPALDAPELHAGTTPRSSRGSSPASRWSRRGSRWRR